MGGRSLRLPRRLSEPIAVASNRFTDLIIFNIQYSNYCGVDRRARLSLIQTMLSNPMGIT